MDDMLRSYLEKKDQDYWRGYKDESLRSSNNNAQNALASSLMQSANQVGSIGGKVASAKPVADMADDLASQSKQNLAGTGMMVKSAQSLDEDKAKLYGNLQEKADLAAQRSADKQYDLASRAQESDLDRKNRLAIAQLAHQGKPDDGNKKDQHLAQVDKMTKDMGNDLDSTMSRGNKPLADLTQRKWAAERLEALNESVNGDPNHMNMREMAAALDSLIRGGSTAVTTVEELVPKTAQGDSAKTMEWIKGEPQGAGQQKFVQMMMKTAKREKELANDQLQEALAGRLSKHQSLRNMGPEGQEAWANILSSRNISPDEVDQHGQYKPKRSLQNEPALVSDAPSGKSGTAYAAPMQPWSPDVLNYARSHGISPESAAEIKRQRGGQ